MLRENFFFSVENKRSNNTKKKALQKCLQFDLMAIFSPLRFPFPRLWPKLSKHQPAHWKREEMGCIWYTENDWRGSSEEKGTDPQPEETQSVLDTYCYQITPKSNGQHREPAVRFWTRIQAIDELALLCLALSADLAGRLTWICGKELVSRYCCWPVVTDDLPAWSTCDICPVRQKSH